MLRSLGFWTLVLIVGGVFAALPDTGSVAHAIGTLMFIGGVAMLCLIFRDNRWQIGLRLRSFIRLLGQSKGTKVVKYRDEKPVPGPYHSPALHSIAKLKRPAHH
jgi:hypothetical protein